MIDNLGLFEINEKKQYLEECKIKMNECIYCGDECELESMVCEACQDTLDSAYDEGFISGLCEEFDVSPRDIEVYDQVNDMYTIEGKEYLITDYDNAYNMVHDNIVDMLWAFNPSFLSDCTGLSVAIFKSLQGIYESSNEAIMALIEATCGIDEVVDEAILYDGRGHFLSTYDGDEIELTIDNYDYLAYRL